MILRRVDGTYVIYNTILAGYQLGQVGLEWQVAGLGGFFGSDTSDMLLRNSNNGGFVVYDISNNQITGRCRPRHRRVGLAGHGLR